MRVLWFTQVELPAVKRQISSAALHRCGWIDSLRAALCAEGSVDLGIAAVGRIPYASFAEEGTHYFRLEGPPQAHGVAAAKARWLHRAHESSLLAQASAIVDQFRPDLIHVHGTEGPLGLVALTSEVPVLISLQGILLACSRAQLSGVPAPDIARDVASVAFMKGQGMVHDAWNLRIAAERELRILRAGDAFAGRTEWDQRILRVVNPTADYYHAEEVLRPQFYQREWRSRPEAPFVVYTTGGPAPYKGLVNLLEAVMLLRASLRPDIQLRVAGQIKDTNMWPAARRAVDRWQLREVVDWLGPLGPDEVAAELEAASVYVHPSIADNSPNALAEAMLLGVPCVASSTGGIPSLLKDGHEGLLCAPGDVYGLAGAIGAVASDSSLAAGMGANARVRASRRNDPRAIVRATVATYEDVLARHHDRGR